MMCTTKKGLEYCKPKDYNMFCNGTCLPATPVKCGYKCQEVRADIMMCNGQCQSVMAVCNGTCLDKNLKVCNNTCIAENDKNYYFCDGQCLSTQMPCHGKCTPHWPVLCGKKCMAEKLAKNFYECKGDCLDISRPCEGKCHQLMPKKCGPRCLAENNTRYQDVKGKCRPSKLFCGKCMDHLPYKCSGKCFANDTDDKYVNVIETCDDTRNFKLKENECEVLCVDKKTYLRDFQDCDGQCISKQRVCNKSKCSQGQPCDSKVPVPAVSADSEVDKTKL